MNPRFNFVKVDEARDRYDAAMLQFKEAIASGKTAVAAELGDLLWIRAKKLLAVVEEELGGFGGK